MDNKDIQRFERILGKLRLAWYLTGGHLRVCQLLHAISSKTDIFYVTDESLDKDLDKFLDKSKDQIDKGLVKLF